MTPTEFDRKIYDHNLKIAHFEGADIRHSEVEILSQMTSADMSADLLKHVVSAYALRTNQGMGEIDWERAASQIDMNRSHPYQLFDQVTKNA